MSLVAKTTTKELQLKKSERCTLIVSSTISLQPCKAQTIRVMCVEESVAISSLCNKADMYFFLFFPIYLMWPLWLEKTRAYP